MKRILAALALALAAATSFGATQYPLSLLSPTGSTSGQFVTSTGPSSAPAWTTVSLATLGGIVPVLNGGTGVTTAAAELSRIGAAPLASASPTGTWAFAVRPTFNGNAPIDTGNVTTFTTGRLLAIQVISSSGTYTPTAGTTHAILKVVGAGGGSGGTTTTASTTQSIGSPASSGSYVEVYWASPTSQTVTIGTAGAAGAAAGAGGTGGVTSVGSVVSCPGGIGGIAGAATAPPFLGTVAASPAACTITGPSTILSLIGARASQPFAVATTFNPVIVFGGISPLGNAGTYGTASGYGNGGGSLSIGISSTGGGGSAGSPGVVIFYDYQ